MLAEITIEEDSYRGEQFQRVPGDTFYLRLSDLLLGLRAAVGDGCHWCVLDFGREGSPYRSILAAQAHHPAHFAGTVNLNYEFGEGSRISAPDASCDLVPSSQLLEHVRFPVHDLTECRRLLRAGGPLMFSTRCTFQDHGCPYDYQCWDADGLRVHVEEVGLRVRTLAKVTASSRKLAFLVRLLQVLLVMTDRSPFVYDLRFILRILRSHSRRADLFFGCAFPAKDRMHTVSLEAPGHAFYIAGPVKAGRPQ